MDETSPSVRPHRSTLTAARSRILTRSMTAARNATTPAHPTLVHVSFVQPTIPPITPPPTMRTYRHRHRPRRWRSPYLANQASNSASHERENDSSGSEGSPTLQLRAGDLQNLAALSNDVGNGDATAGASVSSDAAGHDRKTLHQLLTRTSSGRLSAAPGGILDMAKSTIDTLPGEVNIFSLF